MAAAFEQNWPKQWQRNGWKNKKGKDVADSILWSEILQELETSGHLLEFEAGKHEFSYWMQWNLHLVQA